MTAQEAFAIAFDEAVVMDAAPNKPGGMPGASGMGGGMGGMGGGMGGLGKKPKKEMSIADHMRIYHPHGFDPKTDKCKLFDRMVSNLESQGIDHETAIKRAMAAHNFGSKSTPKGGDIGETKQYSPEQIDDMVNQMVANPSLTLSLESVPLVQPEMIKTVVGEITVETTTQKAIAQVLAQEAANGNESAKDKLQDIIDYQELIKNYDYKEGATTIEPAQAETFTSTDGSFSVTPNERAAAIINADSDGMLWKKELFQERVNLEAQLKAAKTPEEEADIKDSIETINRLFNGKGSPDGGDALGKSPGSEPSEGGNTVGESEITLKDGFVFGEEENGFYPIYDTDGNYVGYVDDTGTMYEHIEDEDGNIRFTETDKFIEKNVQEQQTENKETEPNKPSTVGQEQNPSTQEVRTEHTESTPSVSGRPIPLDEQFKVGENKYKIGGTTYVDVSGKGLLRGMLSSFLAGLRGEGIITGWDRISGRWDAIKRSEAGEKVRDGIAGALIQQKMSDFMSDNRLSVEAKAELESIQNMMSEAKTAKQKMDAIKAFRKWQEANGYAEKSSGGKNRSGVEPKFTSEMIESMDSVHKDGGITESGVTFGKDGKAVKKDIPRNHSLPTSDVMGKAKWNKKAKIENLEDKKNKLENYLSDELGITPSKIDATPSFNQTILSFDVDNASQGRAVEKHIDDIMGALGENAQATYDPKSRKVMIAVQNQIQGDVTAKEIFASDEWGDAKKTMKCPLVIGKDMTGKPVIADMKKLVHLLVAGQTGKGKSVAMNTILTSILMGSHPDDVKIVLIDPKGVEFGAYGSSPHNLLPVAETPEDSLSHIKWLENEVANRQRFLNEANKKFGQDFKDIDEYNDWAKENGQKTLPRIVCAIDELTELKAKAGPDFEKRLKSLGNIARFTGINLIVATQHPTKENIGGLKDNLPSRLAFSATNKEASQAILGHGDEIDKSTGEKKLGTGSIHRSGEFLFETESGGQIHGQGANTGNEDVKRVSAFWEDKELPPVQEGSEEESPSDRESNRKPERSEGNGDTNNTEINSDNTYEGHTNWMTSETRDDAQKIIQKKYDDAVAKAKDTLLNSKGTESDWNKFEKAKEKAQEEFNKTTHRANTLFGSTPSDIDDEGNKNGENLEMPEEDASRNREEHQEEDDESPSKIMERAKTRLNREKDKIKKARDEGRLSERKARQQLSELEKRYKYAEAVFNSNGTADEILDVLEPEEKKEEKPEQVEPTTNEYKEKQEEQEDKSKEQKQVQELAERNSKVKATVKPPKFYSGRSVFGSEEAVEKLTDKEQKKIKETLLPDGWDFVTENGFNAPARTQKGWIYVQNPENGSHGHIYKDPKTGSLRLWKEVDTTHPDYKGFVKNEQGEWELSPEAREIEEESKRIRKYSKNETEREEALRKLNHARYGRDEAPDNKTIIAHAIAEALSEL